MFQHRRTHRTPRPVSSLLESLEPRQLLSLVAHFTFDDAASGVAMAEPLGWMALHASDADAAQLDLLPGRTAPSDRAILLNNPASDKDALLFYNLTNPAPLSNTLANSASLVFWIKTTAVGSANPAAAPAVLGAYDSANPARSLIWGTLDDAGRIGITVGTTTLKSSTPINDNQWHQVAFTRDLPTGQTRIFIDSLPSASAILDPGLSHATPDYQTLGRLVDQNNNPLTYFPAAFDDLSLYNHALDSTQFWQPYTPSPSATTLAVQPTNTQLQATVTLSSPNAIDALTWGSILQQGNRLIVNAELGRRMQFTPSAGVPLTHTYTLPSLPPRRLPVHLPSQQRRNQNPLLPSPR